MDADTALNTCPKCGDSFTCGQTTGIAPCWCAKLPHLLPCSNADAACFCPRCLGEALGAVVASSDPAAELSNADRE